MASAFKFITVLKSWADTFLLKKISIKNIKHFIFFIIYYSYNNYKITIHNIYILNYKYIYIFNNYINLNINNLISQFNINAEEIINNNSKTLNPQQKCPYNQAPEAKKETKQEKEDSDDDQPKSGCPVMNKGTY